MKIIYIQNRSLLLITWILITSCFITCTNKLQLPAAKPLGPAYGGRITGIAPDIEDPNKLAVSGPGGGVWVTKDNGANWTELWKGLNDPTICHLEFDLLNPKRLYAISPSTLFAIDDPFGNPSEWIELAGGTESGQVPLPPSRMLFRTSYGFQQLDLGNGKRAIIWARSGTGMYYSFEGKTFKRHDPITSDSTKAEAFITTIGVDGKNRVYFGTLFPQKTWETSVYRSKSNWTQDNPSLSWEKVTTGLQDRSEVLDMAWMSTPKKMALLVNEIDQKSSQVYFMDLGATAWKPTKSKLPSPNAAPTCITSLGGNRLIVGAIVNWMTTDLGKTWNDIDWREDHPDIRVIVRKNYSKLKKDYVWKASDGYRYFRFDPVLKRKGNLMRWEQTKDGKLIGHQHISCEGLSIWQTHASVGVHPPNSKARLFTGSQDGGGLCLDEGGSWLSKGGPDVGCGDVWAIAVAPSDPNRIYARGCGQEFGRTENAQSAASCADITWKVFNGDDKYFLAMPNFLSNGMIGIHPKNKNRVFFACSREIAYSADGGQSFSFHKLPNKKNPYCVYVTERAVYAAGERSGIYESTDNGKTWKKAGLNDNPPRAITNLLKTAYKGGTFYAATSEGLFRKYPNEKWIRITRKEVPVMDVVSNPLCPKFVWIGMGYDQHGTQKGEVLVSANHGDTWRTLYEEGTPISDLELAVGPKSPSLIISSYGHGVYTVPLTKDCN